jgi:hypothetical protein
MQIRKSACLRGGLSGLVLSCAATLASSAYAAPVDCSGSGCQVSDATGAIALNHGSPYITTDGFGYNVLNQGGLSWQVGGKSVLFAQSSFFRISGAGSETPLSALLWESAAADAATGTIHTVTEPGNIQVENIYSLQPQIPGRLSQLMKDTKVTNTSGGTIDLTWIEFFDFDLNGVPIESDDALTSTLHAGTRVITQSNSQVGLRAVNQWGMVTQNGQFVFDQPVGYALGSWRNNPNVGTPSLLETLVDGAVTNLTQSPDAVGHPNDYMFAVQFSFSGLGDGEWVSFRSLSTVSVPEPASLALLLLGGVGLRLSRCRKNAQADQAG